MTVVMTIWTPGHRHPLACVSYAHLVVPEPYQAGVDSTTYSGGHEPGACCTTRTCGWMGLAMGLGHQSCVDR